MNYEKTPVGHLTASVTVLIWGTASIFTKVFPRSFSPVKILFTRFTIGYLALRMICPGSLVLDFRKQEYLFVAVDLCGVIIYYLLENIALAFASASNVGVIISITSSFTAILNCLFLGGSRPGKRFFTDFLLVIAGTCFISFGSNAALSISPVGDVLAVATAVIWVVYSTLTKKINALSYDAVQATKRTSFYGILFMVPVVLTMGFHVTLDRIVNPLSLCNLLFLGLGASAPCFVAWNLAVKLLGPMRTNVYVYMVPAITTVGSVIILRKPVTITAIRGILLTSVGLSLPKCGSQSAQSASTPT